MHLARFVNLSEKETGKKTFIICAPPKSQHEFSLPPEFTRLLFAYFGKTGKIMQVKKLSSDQSNSGDELVNAADCEFKLISNSNEASDPRLTSPADRILRVDFKLRPCGLPQ